MGMRWVEMRGKMEVTRGEERGERVVEGSD